MSTTLHICVTTPGNENGRSVEELSQYQEVDRLARLNRSHFSDYYSHDQSTFRLQFTEIPNYTYDLVGWQEEHPVGNSEENPSYLGGEL